MAGARIEFAVDTTLVSTALQRAMEVLGGDGLALLLSDIGEYLLIATRDRAALQRSPDGTRWEALSPRYAARKAKVRAGVPLLKFDGHMLGDRLAHQLDEGRTAVLVGTSVPYGAIHQFGGTVRHAAYSRVRDRASIPAGAATIPARPWLGISDQDATEIVQITQDHLTAALSG